MAQQQRRQQQAVSHIVTDDDWNAAEPADVADSPYGQGGGGIVPEGWYDIIVDKAYVRTSSSSGMNYPNIECRISKGEYTGRFLFSPCYINSPSVNYRKSQLDFLKRWFESCGQEIPSSCPEIDEDMSPVTNCEASVYAVIEDKNNVDGTSQPANRVVRVCALGAYETPQDERQAQDEQAATAAPQRTAPRQPAAAPRQAAATPQTRQSSPATAPRPQQRAPAAAAPRQAAAAPRGNGQQRPAAQQQQRRAPQAAGDFSDMQEDIPF